MKRTYRQPPNMKGKKTYLFGCGCCWARDCREEERARLDLREIRDVIGPTQPLGKEFEEVLFDNIWKLYAR